MSYHITIKRVTSEQVATREWEQVGTKVDDDGNEKPEYGYVDNEKTEDVERTVYTQRVEDLDMKLVIDAVNGMDTMQLSAPIVVTGESNGK